MPAGGVDDVPSENSRHESSSISSTMSTPEVISILVLNGCPDVTSQLDLERCGKRPISGGGFGDVYQGEIIGNTKIAIKCARLHLIQSSDGYKVLKRAARELYVWSTLQHENVLELVGLAIFQNQLCMISPWMDGGDLPSYLERSLDVDRLQLCYQISGGLAYLHEKGIVHGDVKGLNVLVSENGIAKLTDFGNTVLNNYTLQFTGVLSASNYTLRWAAPELLKGVTNMCTEKTDVYALGMTILEVITGKIPFHEKHDQAVFNYVIWKHGIPTRPIDFFSAVEEKADGLWDLLVCCWNHDPDIRPTSASIRGLILDMHSLDGVNSVVSSAPKSDSNNELQENLRTSQAMVFQTSGLSDAPTSIDESSHNLQAIDTSTSLTKLRPKLSTNSQTSLIPSLKLNLVGLGRSELTHVVHDNAAPEVHNACAATASSPQNDPAGENTGDGLDGLRKAIHGIKAPPAKGRTIGMEPRGGQDDAEILPNSARQNQADLTDKTSIEIASSHAMDSKKVWNDEDLEVLDQLGEGAGGTVYRVKDRKTDKLMARKTIPTSGIPEKQLRRELQFSQLDHPNLLAFYGAYIVSADCANLCILMELCDGGSLAEIGRQIRFKHSNLRIGEKAVAHLVRDVLQGLDYLHKNKVIHRDIKPSNILVTKSGVAKICDFGVSGELVASLASTFTGTSWYMAPERITGHPYSIRADVWSLGITFLEIVQNRFPYPLDFGPIELLTYICNGMSPVLTDEPGDDYGNGKIVWSDEMKSFFEQCLRIAATDRPRPCDLLEHPWILGKTSKQLNMAKFIREVWGWQEKRI